MVSTLSPPGTAPSRSFDEVHGGRCFFSRWVSLLKKQVDSSLFFSVSQFPVKDKTVKQKVIRSKSSCWGLDEDELDTDTQEKMEVSP